MLPNKVVRPSVIQAIGVKINNTVTKYIVVGNPEKRSKQEIRQAVFESANNGRSVYYECEIEFDSDFHDELRFRPICAGSFTITTIIAKDDCCNVEGDSWETQNVDDIEVPFNLLLPICKPWSAAPTNQALIDELNEALSSIRQKITNIYLRAGMHQLEFCHSDMVLFTVDFSNNTISTSEDNTWITATVIDILKKYTAFGLTCYAIAEETTETQNS